MTELVSEERLKKVVYSVVGKYMNAAGGCNDELPRIGLMIARAALKELGIEQVMVIPVTGSYVRCPKQGAILVKTKDRTP